MDAGGGTCAASAPGACSDAANGDANAPGGILGPRRMLALMVVMPATLVIAALVAMAVFSKLATSLLRLVCWPLGVYLRKKTEGRREQLLEIVEADELAWRQEHAASSAARGVNGRQDAEGPSGAAAANDAGSATSASGDGAGELSQAVEDGWENIAAAGGQISSSGNGEPEGDQWDGVVGFLHPFWYVSLCPR
jgi:hypothetical protein